MNIAGIVCEYNPFHSGHLYQLTENRRALGDDALTVCVMSGDFVQRGEAAIFSKFARAEAACRAGADLVLELPLPWCLSSAEGFAGGAVSLLDAVGCTHLSFGSESGDVESLQKLAREILKPGTRQEITALLQHSPELSYAMAREQVLTEKLGECGSLLSQPNNILAVEYLKAIYKNSYPITPVTVKRIGSGHDKAGEHGPKSASELRQLMETGTDISEYIPEAALSVYRRERAAGHGRNSAVLETALLSRLRMLDKDVFETLPDGGDGAGVRLWKAVREESTLEDIAQAARSKRYPLARMRRMLLCAALGVSAEYTKTLPPYARVLAADAAGCAYLREIDGKSAVPVLTKPAAVRRLNDNAAKVFALGASAHDVYNLQNVTNSDKKCGQDWRNGPTIVQFT